MNKVIPNPTGKGGFGDNPKNRSDGRWSKENSFSYWYNYFKNLSVEEFKAEADIPDKDKSVARELAYRRVINARTDIKEFQEVANRSEGMPKQSIDHTSQGTHINPYRELTDDELDQRIKETEGSEALEADKQTS